MSYLKHNLVALSVHQSRLAQLLRESEEDLDIGDIEHPSLLYRGVRIPWFFVEKKKLFLRCRMHKNVFCFGAGLGHLPWQLLKHNPQMRMLIWERDPATLKEILKHCDFSEMLVQNRLKLLLGMEIISWTSALKQMKVLPLPGAIKRYNHHWQMVSTQNLGSLYCVIDGGLLVDDICTVLNQGGNTALTTAATERELNQALRYGIKGLISINYHVGSAELCERLKIPLYCWEIDPTLEQRVTLKTTSHQTRFFTYRRRQIPLLKKGGIENVKYLPLAVPSSRRPETADFENLQICFVGSSMKKNAQSHLNLFRKNLHKRTIDLEDKIERIFQAQLNNLDEYCIPDLMKDEFGDIDAYFHPYSPELLLAEYCASERRFRYLVEIQRACGLKIDLWGDRDWAQLNGEGFEYRGFAGHKVQLNQIYSSDAVHIDINRLYQKDMITLRVFEVMGCCGFILAEHSQALEDYFDLGVELESWKTKEELIDKVNYYINHPQKRKKIANRGFAAVRERALIKHRLIEMGLMCEEREAGEIQK